MRRYPVLGGSGTSFWDIQPECLSKRVYKKQSKKGPLKKRVGRGGVARRGARWVGARPERVMR
eukprot:1069042-Karenia_brevis.AAC.1